MFKRKSKSVGYEYTSTPSKLELCEIRLSQKQRPFFRNGRLLNILRDFLSTAASTDVHTMEYFPDATSVKTSIYKPIISLGTISKIRSWIIPFSVA